MNTELQKIQKDTEEWLENFIEKPNTAFGGLEICPFAKHARTNKKITFRIGKHPYHDLVEHCKDGNQGYDVFIYAYDPSEWDTDAFHEMVYKANDENLADHDMISLPDHPHSEERVNGVILNQGTYAYNMIAPLAALNSASAKLHSEGYYNHWRNAEEYMEAIFRGRVDPRTGIQKPSLNSRAMKTIKTIKNDIMSVFEHY
jgi:hypothetical protein